MPGLSGPRRAIEDRLAFALQRLSDPREQRLLLGHWGRRPFVAFFLAAVLAQDEGSHLAGERQDRLKRPVRLSGDLLGVTVVPAVLERVVVGLAVRVPHIPRGLDRADREDLLRSLVRHDALADGEVEQQPDLVGLLLELRRRRIQVAVGLAERRQEDVRRLVLPQVTRLLPADANVAARLALVPELGVGSR